MLKLAVRLGPLSILAALVAAPAATAADPVDLTLLGRTAAGGETTAEIAAFDPTTNRVFATNADANALDVYDFSDPTAPLPVESISLAAYGAGPNSVAYSPRFGGIVAVAVEAAVVGEPGTIEVFDTDGDRLVSFAAGALPDMVTFTEDDRFLLAANEGEPADDGSVDPEGSVTVVDLRRAKLAKAKTRQATFDGVPLSGPVRIFTPGSTVEEDLEPEYITTAGKRAYVSIQEANAVAILDIREAEFEVVKSLGFKDHSAAGNGFDATDEDEAPTIETHDNVFGMYQPDAIASYTLRVPKKVNDKGRTKLVDRTYVATANEGDARDYDFFSEEERVEDLLLDEDAFGPTAADPLELGRLNVTTTLGDTDTDGDYDELYAFGARSMSLLDAEADLVYDTGDELETLASTLDAGNYNKDHSADSVIDNRSDNKGPEPEAVTTGVVCGTTYAFLAAERSGMIYAYDLSTSPGEAEFAGFINTRNADRGPEGIEFVPASQSPNGSPMLLVTYEITGTVASYAVTPTG